MSMKRRPRSPRDAQLDALAARWSERRRQSVARLGAAFRACLPPGEASKFADRRDEELGEKLVRDAPLQAEALANMLPALITPRRRKLH